MNDRERAVRPVASLRDLRGTEHRIVLYLLATWMLMILRADAQQSEPFARIHGTRIDLDLYGNLYVLDQAQSMVRLYAPDGKLLHELGGAGWQNEQFDHPSGIWARNGIDLFVADYGNHRIQRFDRNLLFVSSLSTRDRENPAERFGYPLDVAVSPMGDLYICDGENIRILKVTRDGRAELSFGDYGAGEGRLHAPTRIQIGPDDNVYVLDGNRIMVYDTFGNFLGALYADLFRHPASLFADADGILVADSGTLYSFDALQRPGPSLLLSAFTHRPELPVVSLGAHNGTVYLLTEDGIFNVPDPRSGQKRLLDKE